MFIRDRLQRRDCKPANRSCLVSPPRWPKGRLGTHTVHCERLKRSFVRVCVSTCILKSYKLWKTVQSNCGRMVAYCYCHSLIHAEAQVLGFLALSGAHMHKWKFTRGRRAKPSAEGRSGAGREGETKGQSTSSTKGGKSKEPKPDRMCVCIGCLKSQVSMCDTNASVTEG